MSKFEHVRKKSSPSQAAGYQNGFNFIPLTRFEDSFSPATRDFRWAPTRCRESSTVMHIFFKPKPISLEDYYGQTD